MSNAIREGYKIVHAFRRQEVLSASSTSTWIPMAGVRRVLAVMTGEALAAGATCKMTLRKAKTSAGGNAADIQVGDAKREATVTANGKVKAVTIDVETTDNNDTLVVNGVTYKKVASGATGNEYEAAAGLNTLINARDGLSSSVATHVVTVVADPGNNVTAAVGAVDEGTTTIATLSSMVIVETTDEEVGEGFTHIAAKVDPSATGNYQVVFLMEGKALPVSQGDVAAQFPT